MKNLHLLAASSALLLIAACASGVPVAESSVAKEAVPEGMSRIAVYRTSILGLAIQPKVNVDGVDTGRCTPNGVFYVEVKPGQHTVSATTEVTKTSYVSVAAGETAYIRCSIGFGLIAGQPKLDVVETSIGQADTQQLKVMGKY